MSFIYPSHGTFNNPCLNGLHQHLAAEALKHIFSDLQKSLGRQSRIQNLVSGYLYNIAMV